MTFASLPTLREIVAFAFTFCGILLLLPSANAQRLPSADAYYLEFSLNALRRPVFCHRLDSAVAAPRSYAVDFDSLGRPVQVTRLFFGNLDSYGDWTIMKFRYDTLGRGSRLVRRTWHNPSGFPVPIGVAHGEDILYDSSGALLMITAIDANANRVERVNAVTRSLYRPMPDGSYLQEWRYSNNKQYDGSERDLWGTQFAPLDRRAWFRNFRVDERGYVVEETPWSIQKKPVPFPGGELVRRYERNACGNATSIRFLDLNGDPMADSSGVARIDFEYDHAGRLTAWRSYDIEGNPTGRSGFNGAASMSRTYREFDGAMIQETFYDASGAEVKKPTEGDVPGGRSERG